MNTVKPSQDRPGFTLLELLLVVLIVGILAMILLPVIGKAKARSRQIDCMSQLRQIGIAHHAFAHEHNSHFPFQVSMREGGTLELVQFGGANVQTAFQHFRALSNDLPEPRVLTCPADKRIRALTFSEFRNENLSYFVSVTADYNRPGDVLGGDRNIRLNGDSTLAIMRFSPTAQIAWTGDIHEYDGNLLFTDTHVERRSSAGLQSAFAESTNRVVAWVPSDAVSQAGGGAPNNSDGSSGGADSVSGFPAMHTVFQSGSGSPRASPSVSPSPGSPSASPAVNPRAMSGRRTASVASSAAPSTEEVGTNAKPSAFAAPSKPTATSQPEKPVTTPTPDPRPVSVATLVMSGPNWWWLVLLAGLTLATLIAVLVYRHDRRRLARAATLGRRTISYGIMAERRRTGRRR